jgi:micrococcal nuclease
MNEWLYLAPIIVLGALMGTWLIEMLVPAWETVRISPDGRWLYQVNRDTGERRIAPSPDHDGDPEVYLVDWGWAKTGKFHSGLWPKPKIAPHVNYKGKQPHTTAFLILAAIICLIGTTPAMAEYKLSGDVKQSGGYRPRSCRAVDGDTAVCRLARTVRRYRFLGFDAPEITITCESKRGMDAKAELQRLLNGKLYIREALVRSRDIPGVPQPALDKYGRRLVSGTSDGRDIASTMIANGMGRPYNGGKRQPWPGC